MFIFADVQFISCCEFRAELWVRGVRACPRGVGQVASAIAEAKEAPSGATGRTPGGDSKAEPR